MAETVDSSRAASGDATGAERTEVIGGRVDRVVGGRTECVIEKAIVVIEEGVADHLTGTVDSSSEAVRPERAEVIGSRIDGGVGRSSERVHSSVASRGETDHPAYAIDSNGVAEITAERAEVIGGRIDRAVRSSSDACVAVLLVVKEEPTTWPESLIPVAELESPPRVPRSSLAGLIGLLAAVRKA